MILPSGGDTGYIDMVLQDEEMQVVYYSTHENSITRIYFAQIDYEIQTDIFEEDMPLTYKLYQNYPNPFNAYTNISYEIPFQSNVTITIYNIAGKQITKIKTTTI